MDMTFQYARQHEGSAIIRHPMTGELTVDPACHERIARALMAEARRLACVAEPTEQ